MKRNRNEYMREYRAKNRERLNAVAREKALYYYHKYHSRERVFKWKTLGYSSYKEYRKDYEREWRKRNPHKRYERKDPDLAYKRWYAKTYLKRPS
jgi:hypothetical protein